MATVKRRRVATETYGSASDLKKALKRGGGASAKIGYVPEDPITVRFLSEPETWVGYWEHYNGPDAEPRYSPCVQGECDVNPYMNQKPTFRYLANAYNVDSGKVQALKLPKSVVDTLMKYFENYKTILDRDYVISRSGSGMKTEYSAIPDDKSPLNLKRFRKDMYDLEDLLEEWADEQDAADEDDDEEEEAPPRRRSRSRTRPDEDIEGELRREARRQGRRYEDLDDDDEEEEERPKVKPRGAVARRSRLEDHPGGIDEFIPRKRPASTRGVEDEEDEKPKRAVRRTSSSGTVKKSSATVKRTVRRR